MEFLLTYVNEYVNKLKYKANIWLLLQWCRIRSVRSARRRHPGFLHGWTCFRSQYLVSISVNMPVRAHQCLICILSSWWRRNVFFFILSSILIFSILRNSDQVLIPRLGWSKQRRLPILQVLNVEAIRVHDWKSLKIWNASRICVSSLRRGHANLLCIVPILVYVLPERAHSILFLLRI